MDAGRLDLLENGQVRSGVDGRALCGLVVVRVGVWGVAGDNSSVDQNPLCLQADCAPQEELYTLAWGQAAWLPCPCPRLPGCPAVCGERRFQQKGRQGIGEHRMDCGIGAQIGQGKGVNQGLPVEHRIGCPRFG